MKNAKCIFIFINVCICSNFICSKMGDRIIIESFKEELAMFSVKFMSLGNLNNIYYIYVPFYLNV